MFEVCVHQIQELLTLVKCDPHQMKELVGIERRLSELEKRLNEAKKIAKEQSDLAQVCSGIKYLKLIFITKLFSLL